MGERWGGGRGRGVGNPPHHPPPAFPGAGNEPRARRALASRAGFGSPGGGQDAPSGGVLQSSFPSRLPQKFWAAGRGPSPAWARLSPSGPRNLVARSAGPVPRGHGEVTQAWDRPALRAPAGPVPRRPAGEPGTGGRAGAAGRARSALQRDVFTRPQLLPLPMCSAELSSPPVLLV